MSNDEKETYGGGVESREGTIPLWLAVTYVVCIAWGIYYLIAYWSGGPAQP